MKHIRNEFGQRIKYVCISSYEDEQILHHHREVYIQIILKKTINKKTYFLKVVSGWIHEFSACVHSLSLFQ